MKEDGKIQQEFHIVVIDTCLQGSEKHWSSLLVKFSSISINKSCNPNLVSFVSVGYVFWLHRNILHAFQTILKDEGGFLSGSLYKGLPPTVMVSVLNEVTLRIAHHCSSCVFMENKRK